MRGLITKGIGGFYYVRTEQGVVQTRGRGIFRNEDITPTVGDEVEISLLEGGDGVVEEILPRRNLFARPPIANVDRIVIDAPFRGMGIGRALYRAVFDRAAESGTGLVTCEVDIVPHNGPSLEFHKAMGFEEVGLRKGLYKEPTEDALLMTKHYRTETGINGEKYGI